MIYFIVYLNDKLQYGLWRYHISPDHLVQGNSYWQCSLLSRNQMHVPVLSRTASSLVLLNTQKKTTRHFYLKYL